jgi:hypothetical protein
MTVPSGRRLMLGLEGVHRGQEHLVAIAVGFDVHRGQITFDALDSASGEVTTGRITPADRQGLRRFLESWEGEQMEAAVEAHDRLAVRGGGTAARRRDRRAGRAGRDERAARSEAAREDR